MMKQLLHSLFGATEQGKPRPGCLGEQWGVGGGASPGPIHTEPEDQACHTLIKTLLCSPPLQSRSHTSHLILFLLSALPSPCSTLLPTSCSANIQASSACFVVLRPATPFASSQFFPLSFLSFKEVKFT